MALIWRLSNSSFRRISAPALVWLLLTPALVAQTTGSTRTLEDLLPPPLTEIERQGLWRQTRCCGPNALYMLAIARGFSPSYQSIRDRCPITDSGSSLADLLATALEHGLPAVAGRMSYASLLAHQGPLLIHLENVGYDSATPTGHFVVAIGWRNGNLAVLDGGTAAQYSIPPDRLRKIWSGYALCLDKSPAIDSKWCDLALAAITFGCTYWLLGWFTRRKLVQSRLQEGE
jgi:hypothetical protein